MGSILATCICSVQDFPALDHLPVPIIYIFGVSPLFYDPSGITFTPFCHFNLEEKWVKPTTPVQRQIIFLSSKLRRSCDKLQLSAKCSMELVPSCPRSKLTIWFSSHKASLRPQISHISIMAEDKGVCDVNGKAEVVEVGLENGEADEDEKGNKLIE